MVSPVSGVWRKIERADLHVKDFKRLRARFQDEKAKAVVCQGDQEDPRGVVWRLVDVSVPDDLRLVVGDAVHNLRTSLDYLVDILVRANDQSPETYTAFPVWRKRGVPGRAPLESLVCRKVRGVAPKVFHAFEALQPYEGGAHEQLWALDQLDIIDKHRLPLLLTMRLASRGAQVRIGNRADEDERPPAYLGFSIEFPPFKDGDVLARLPRAGDPKTDDRVKFAFDVALGEPEILRGDQVLLALSKMRKAVLEAVREFRVFL
ncbi:MAG: hypothetical protein WB802_14300 [Candidatus Dormiibacterota bacterium]